MPLRDDRSRARRGHPPHARGNGPKGSGARSQVLAGRAVALAGDRTAAIRVLRSAKRILDAIGVEHDRDLARRERRRLKARSEPRGPAAPGNSGLASLSTREREVAELVTARHTNREIAEKLVLSEKTVESHLRNIFAKLGASSRVEVAREQRITVTACRS
jgi:DNA-binding NarL/FixJ family response regulator